jgi:predicted regulator of Ras-like GTPase activity (Roadblock/LC7/MglB family)
MAGRGQVAALGRLEGVHEATLCAADGTVLESSSSRPELAAAALSLQAALASLQGRLQGFARPVTLTVDTEQGSLHLAQSGDAVLVVTTGTEANLGAVRLEMREALRALNE